MRFCATFLFLSGLALQFVPMASAQSIPFQLLIQDQNSNTTPVSDGSTITLAANALNQGVTVTLIASYTGTGTAAIGAQSQFFGPPEFSVSLPTPTTLGPQGNISVGITFNPTAAAQASAQFFIPFTETVLSGTTPTSNSGSITLNLIGTAPNFVVAYAFPTNQNVLPLSNGATITFPGTAVSSTSTAAIVLENEGSGSGTITSVAVTGAAFQTQGLPLLPGSVNAASSTQFSVIYSPTQAETDMGTLLITFPDHTVSVNLVGTGIAPVYTYQLSQNGQTASIVPGTVAISNVNVGSSGSFSITVQNTGTGSGTINGIGLSGAGFQLTNAPAFPQTLLPNASLTLAFSFTPPQAGTFTGQLQIGSATFAITGQGTGGQLTYSYTNGAGVNTVSANGAVLFSPVQVGQSSTASFAVQNTGTSTATVTSISIGQTQSAFSLSSLPPLPLALAPGAATSFTITFAPLTTGSNTTTLAIDTQTFTLFGSGNAPPPLPGFQFVGASGTQQPLQQPSIGLTLSAPYSLPLTGTLTIIENPEGFSPDPSVQFSTGGQTVNFTIPANTTEAIFPNGATTIRLQTGSVSATITVSPTFATSAGYNLTPANPATVQFTVPDAPPQLLGAVVTASSASGFTLQITGVVASRTLTTLNFSFAGASGFSLASTNVPVDVSSASSAWFQSSQSAAFGGQFAITVPFTLTLSSSGTTGTSSPLSAVQSVSVTAANGLGTSNSVTAQVQ